MLGYTLLFILAVLGGQILWRLYMKLDSSRYPVKNYADIGERIFGKFVRHFFNILQSIQLLLNVGLLTLGSAQSTFFSLLFLLLFLFVQLFLMMIDFDRFLNFD